MKVLFTFLFLLFIWPTAAFSSDRPEEINSVFGKVSLVEYPSGVFPVLNEFPSSPNLIYLSGDPLLRPAPDQLSGEITELIQNGSQTDFIRRGSPQSAELLILPAQTVRVATQNGLVNAVTWVAPSQKVDESISLEFFRNRLVGNGSLTEVESATFITSADKSLKGEINSRPFKVTTIHNLPATDSPSLLLIDLSYFLSVYEDEIKTPIFPLVHSIISTLLSNTDFDSIIISYSTGVGDVPLKLRFLGPVLASLATDPELVNQPAPTNWRRFSNNMYLVNFHQVEEIWESALLMTKTEPDNPAWHYNLHEAYNLLKMPNKALTALDRAVQLDSGYALELVNLAHDRLRSNDYTTGIELLTRAQDSGIQQVFIKLDLAITNLKAGNNNTALAVAEELEKLPWSPVYFPNMPTTLEQIKVAAGALPLMNKSNSLNVPDLLGPAAEKE